MVGEAFGSRAVGIFAAVFTFLVLLTTACIRLDRWPAIGLGALVAAAKRFTPQRYAEIVTTSYTGMRPGELYAVGFVRHAVRAADIAHTRGV